MPSHISKNVSTLSAKVTRLIVSKNKLNIAPSKGSKARPSVYDAVYPAPYMALE